jgi:hypothetical protein
METIGQPQSNGIATAAMVCGIVACICNLLVITAIFGIILGTVAAIMGAVAYRKHPYGKTGFVLGLWSWAIVAVYLFSWVAVMAVDPFI